MQWHVSGECPVAVVIECHGMRVIFFVNNNKILITTTNTSNNKYNKNNIHAQSANCAVREVIMQMVLLVLDNKKNNI